MILDELATYLQSQGVASTSQTANWAVFKGYEPSSGPHKCLTLFETGGDQNEQHISTPIDRPTFQVRVRSDDFGYSTGRAKMSAARTALELIGNSTLSGRRFVHVVAMSEPISLGVDENSRPRWVMNFRAIRSRTS